MHIHLFVYVLFSVGKAEFIVFVPFNFMPYSTLALSQIIISYNFLEHSSLVLHISKTSNTSRQTTNSPWNQTPTIKRGKLTLQFLDIGASISVSIIKMAKARIVGVAMDFSPTSKLALRWAVDNLINKGDQIIMINVQPPNADHTRKELFENTGSR